MEIALAVTHFVLLRIKGFKDKKGNPTTVDGPPTWTTDNTDAVSLTPSADGMECKVTAIGPLSAVPVTVTAAADADKTPGIKLFMASARINLTAGDAATMELEADTPVEQPE